MRAARRIARAAAATFDAIGRARLARDRSVVAGARRLHEACAALCDIHGVVAAVSGRWPDGPAVVVANHVGYLDPIVLCGLRPMAPIAKGEVAAWPVIGAAATAMSVHFVDREDPADRARVLRRAVATLRAGATVLNFPEGTTTDGTRLLPFHRGGFGAARLAGVPVVPVALAFASPALTWTGGATFLPHYLRTAGRRSIAVRVAIGDPLDPRSGWPAEDLARLAHRRVASLLRDLQEPDEPATRVAVPPPRPGAVLPAAGARRAAAR